MQTSSGQAQAAPLAPAVAQAPVAGQATTVAGADVAVPAAATYLGARNMRDELRSQRDALVSQRHGYMRELEDHGEVGGQAVAGMQQRIGQIDARIADMDKLIATADAQVAQAAALPGAVIDEPRFERDGPPREVFIFIPLLLAVVFVPMSIAMARRIWKRSSTKVAEFPREIMDRLSRLEQMGEATSLEIERIGEGQRFVTKLLTERPDRIGAGIESSPPR